MNDPGRLLTELSYTAITGRVYACPGLARRLKTMQWQTNRVYNATVAADRDFTAAVERRLADAQARRTGAAPPPEAAKLDGWNVVDGKRQVVVDLPCSRRAGPAATRTPTRYP